jgi:hypothetical protein
MAVPRDRHKEPAGAVDDDLWDAWAFAEIDSGLALDAWQTAAPADQAAAHAAYCAALDREERAAAALAAGAGP